MNIYLLLKSIHLIAVISWMAGLLYLPRLFVYHAESMKNKKSDDLILTFQVMERRLFIYIMNPAMIVSWIFGILLIHTMGLDNLSSFWLQLKLLFVFILTIYHFFCSIVLENLLQIGTFIHLDFIELSMKYLLFCLWVLYLLLCLNHYDTCNFLKRYYIERTFLIITSPIYELRRIKKEISCRAYISS